MKTTLLVALGAVCCLSGNAWAAEEDVPFDDPMFRRCVAWLLTGEKGALIGNICISDYNLPSPSMFLCARKIQTGFKSAADQEACALVLEEEAKKVRAGFVK